VAASWPVRRLLPSVPNEARDSLEPLDLAAAYADTRRGPHDGRPWVLINMITSIDGASALDGASGGLGNAGDRAVFSVLRALADTILVGAGTVRSERYGPPRKPGQKVAVVTRTADLDWSSALFASGAGLAIVPDDGPPVPVPSVRAGRGHVELVSAIAQLDARVVLAEGGPSLNGQLLAAGLVDELCLTIAPKLIGGGAQRIIAGPSALTAMELVHVLEDDGFLFCRYLTHG
jgi:riboflavin biosynthesis pyrimidine reductase